MCTRYEITYSCGHRQATWKMCRDYPYCDCENLVGRSWTRCCEICRQERETVEEKKRRGRKK
jgi:hypothetical protein